MRLIFKTFPCFLTVSISIQFFPLSSSQLIRREKEVTEKLECFGAVMGGLANGVGALVNSVGRILSGGRNPGGSDGVFGGSDGVSGGSGFGLSGGAGGGPSDLGNAINGVINGFANGAEDDDYNAYNSDFLTSGVRGQRNVVRNDRRQKIVKPKVKPKVNSKMVSRPLSISDLRSKLLARYRAAKRGQDKKAI